MAQKPSVPKGTRDFLPKQVIKRKYIFSLIEEVFRNYGYAPIETPTMENLSTLTGKYGEEGDKLLFKVLNNGDFLPSEDSELWHERNAKSWITSISKRGLRYDLTVPFARFVVMNQNELAFPFKRYQIQQVWRADRPQRGRYQEFYQCDVDVVGSTSLMYEAELIKIYYEVFTKLGIQTRILINNRKILYGLSEAAGIPHLFMDMTTAIDKLDKIGREGVINECIERGITKEQVDTVIQLLTIPTLKELKSKFDVNSVGIKGIEEIERVFSFLNGSVTNVKWDISLARGLTYYTGCIFEVKVDVDHHPEIVMGSIGGGGRYDNLTEVFGLSDMSGVGVSFGAERIYDVMEELHLFPEHVFNEISILFITMDEKSLFWAFEIASSLRSQGIACDVYPEPTKLKKQMNYANNRNVPFVGIIGEAELDVNKVLVKDMLRGEQKLMSLEELKTSLQSNMLK